MTERLNQDVMQSSSVEGGCMQVDRRVIISTPSPDSVREMSIRWTDLNKLKRGLTDALYIPTDHSVLSGLFFGFSGSALLTCISLSFSKDLPSWVMPTSIALVVGSFLFGCGTVYFSRELRKIRRKTISNLLADVEEIERRFQSAQQGEIIDQRSMNFLTEPLHDSAILTTKYIFLSGGRPWRAVKRKLDKTWYFVESRKPENIPPSCSYSAYLKLH